MTTPRFIDIHLLQTLPYSNINRDDLGSPKSLVYGGASRTRVSSQSWKRATRFSIEAALGDSAARTRRIPSRVAMELIDRGWPTDLANAAGQQIALSAGKSGLKLEEGGGATSVLLYLPTTAIGQLTELVAGNRAAIEGELGKKKPAPVLPTQEVTKILAERNGVINLFGRMLAELPGAEVDGSVQVAHAFTTHSTNTEVDFFTAVDDLNLTDDRGSGHMNSAEFSSGVFYRYASVDIIGLTKNCGSASAAELTGAFLRAFIAALPTGKQNSTAPNTIPDLAYVAVRSDRPVSLAPAFESPVTATGEGGFAARSRDRLADYAQRLHLLWGTDGVLSHGYASIDEMKQASGLGDRETSFVSLVAKAMTATYPEAAT